MASLALSFVGNMRAARVAYVILCRPFSSEHVERGDKVARSDGPVPAAAMLRLHLWALSKLSHSLAVAMAVSPTDRKKTEMPGYYDIHADARALGCPFELIRVGNNSLGSYGMFLHAFALSRNRGHAFYIFSEVDYVPLLPRFDRVLVEMSDHLFAPPARRGVLASVLQGGVVDADRQPVHLEGSHIMSSAALDALYEHVYGTQRWNRSMSERMLHLVKLRGSRTRGRYDRIQEGFGLLLAEASIELRDYTSAFRTPYWNHAELIDWTGGSGSGTLPMDRVMFAPAQFIYNRTVRRCCGQTWAACKTPRRAGRSRRPPSHVCYVHDWHRNNSDCCASEHLAWAAIRRRAHLTLPVARRWHRLHQGGDPGILRPPKRFRTNI